MTEKLLDYLIYQSYEFNRLNCPHIPAERWKSIFTDAERYELIFNQNHLSNKGHTYELTTN